MNGWEAKATGIAARNGTPTRIRALADLHEPYSGAKLGSSPAMGGLGRFFGFQILVPEEASRYPMATEGWFRWTPCDLGDPWLESLGEEVARTLGAGGLNVRTVDPGTVTVLI